LLEKYQKKIMGGGIDLFGIKSFEELQKKKVENDE